MSEEEWGELREKALQRIQSRRGNVEELSQTDVESLVYNLEVHQAELEAQNEDLRRTQVKLAEMQEQYYNLYEFAPVAYVTLDRGGVILRANLAATELFGVERKEIIGRRFEKLLARDHRDECYLRLQQAAKIDTKQVCEMKLVRGEDQRVWGHVEISPLEEPISGAQEYRIAISEISERKKVEHQLVSLQVDLENRVHQRTSEVKNLSDQLRSLAGKLSNTEQRERKRLASILHDHIQQLLVSAKIQVERMRRRPDAKPLEEDLSTVMEILRETDSACHSLTLELCPPILHDLGLFSGLKWLAGHYEKRHGLKIHVTGDEDIRPASEEVLSLLFECVRELLFNTIKHAGVDEAEVSMMCREDGRIQITVRDRGKGFDRDLLRKRKPEDVSFGLFSIQQRLAAAGGEMVIESDPGEGTSIMLLAPACEPETWEKIPAEVLERIEKGKAEMKASAGTYRVLVVDDHQIMREGLIGLFQFEPDIEVVGEAADGNSAVRMARELEPEVVIMDVNMPEMNGIEATRHILSTHPSTCIIGLSMHVDPEIAEAMREAGAHDYLTKGGPMNDLVDSIRTCRTA
jgi:PAS domain S-box-containing protein